MTPLRNLRQKLSGPGSPVDGDTDLVLGLPLEAGDRTIYPVFADPKSPDDGAEPRQIGYLELSENRSDFTSLESDSRPLIALPVLILLAVVLFWLFRRNKSDQRAA
jgi:hypothetical protein